MDNCRVCLSEAEGRVNIFQKLYSTMISTLIMSVAEVQIHPEDELPCTICSECLIKLDCCIKFIELCEDTDAKLRFYTQCITKDEPAISDVSTGTTSGNQTVKVDYTNDVFDRESQSNKISSTEDVIKVENVIKSRKAVKQQCFTCGKVMSSRYRLRTHLKLHSGERPFSCSHCDKTFALSQSLKVHLRTHTGEKPLQCSECGASFAHSAGLAAHRRKHSGLMPYQCVLCPRSFRTIGHLQYHTRRHTGERKFECETCNRAFITRSQLKEHIRSHSSDKPHVCCVCGLRLTRASNLRRHMQFKHKNFKCNICKEKFLQLTDFEEHVKTHSEET